ncbi:hypothetical protein Q8F55_006381 [Vanrija albida]|uniref:Uncharacterized protein n=1 Tax=Vanrija albida TaxID=181172 RepID=A0ABR3PXV2_9TREE
MSFHDHDPTRQPSHWGAKYYHTGEATFSNPLARIGSREAGPSYWRHSEVRERTSADSGRLDELAATQSSTTMWHAAHCTVGRGERTRTRRASVSPPSASAASTRPPSPSTSAHGTTYTTPRRGSAPATGAHTGPGLALSRTLTRGVTRTMTRATTITVSDPRFTPECPVCERIRSQEADEKRRKHHTPRGPNWSRMLDSAGRKREIPRGWWYRMWN